MSAVTDEIYAANRSVIFECERLRRSIQAISDKNHGPLEKSEIKPTLFPFVLLLGNHSSGKSSFVNFLMERKIQTAGVAPTDDNFTIIAPGETDDVDRDGSSLVGDPDLGFQGLKHFGPVLVHRTQLKIRTGTRAKGFCVVDTPGMIDSPIVKDHFGSGRHSVMDRGYDFEAVCRWYAERADVILLFFDPDKPGTTGETLSILTNSLNGMDHKLHIILNKADQFLKIHDFARAYGSLCWNLSKVIPRKDLPQIHTMCLPIGATANTSLINILPKANGVEIPTSLGGENNGLGCVSGPSVTATYLQSTESNFLRQGYADLEESRMQVMREVFNAPKRRVDHEITRLSDSVYLLLMHCKVIDSTVSRYKARLWADRLSLFTAGCAVAITGVVVCAFAMHSSKQSSLAAGIKNSSLMSISTPSALEVPHSAPLDVKPSLRGSFFGSAVKAAVPLSLPECDSSAIQPHSSLPAISSTDTAQSSNALNRDYSLIKNVFAATATGLTFLTSLSWFQGRSLDMYSSSLTSEEGFEETFSKLYARNIVEGDEFTKALWQKVRSKLNRSVTYVELSAMRRVLGADLLLLERILEEDTANLRRQASPTFPSSSSSRGSRPYLPLKRTSSSPLCYPDVGSDVSTIGASVTTTASKPSSSSSASSSSSFSSESSSSINTALAVLPDTPPIADLTTQDISHPESESDLSLLDKDKVPGIAVRKGNTSTSKKVPSSLKGVIDDSSTTLPDHGNDARLIESVSN